MVYHITCCMCQCVGGHSIDFCYAFLFIMQSTFFIYMFSLEYLGWSKRAVPLGCIFLNCVREDYKLWKILKVSYKLTRISIWPLDRKTFLITVHIVLCASISICRCTKDMLSEREILWLSEGFYLIEPFIIVGLFSMS